MFSWLYGKDLSIWKGVLIRVFFFFYNLFSSYFVKVMVVRVWDTLTLVIEYYRVFVY